MAYSIDGDNIYYTSGGITQHFGAVNKIETVRIDDETVEDIHSQFDLQIGEYVEISRSIRAEALPQPPETQAEKIARLEALNADMKFRLADVEIMLAEMISV